MEGEVHGSLLSRHSQSEMTLGFQQEPVTMPPNGTTTIAGSFSSVGGTFGHSNGTVYFTSLGAETIAASGTPFTNLFYNLTFNGSGSWSFLDTYATTSNNFNLQQGTVTFPSANLSVGGSFTQSGGTFNHNSGTVGFTGAGTYTIDVGASSLEQPRVYRKWE